MKKTIFYTAFSLFLTLFISTNSYAALYGFEKHTDNDGSTVDALNVHQLYVSIEDVSPTNVSFTFYNNVGIDSSITDIVIGDAGNIFSGIVIDSDSDTGNETGVVFNSVQAVNGGGTDYGFTKELQTSTSNGIKPGIDASDEWLKLSATYTDQTNLSNFTDLANQILSGAFNIGLHVQGISGFSEKYVLVDENGPDGPGGFGNQVPLPAALWLFGPALLGFMGFRRKSKS